MPDGQRGKVGDLDELTFANRLDQVGGSKRAQVEKS